MIRQALIISQDTMGNHNQVKGRNMFANFEGSKIDRVDVRGNGQSLFFAVDEAKLTMSGMNRIICSNMVIRFDSANKLETITAKVKPEAAFIPPHKLAAPERRLKGFNWDPSRRPTLAMVVGDQPSKAPGKKLNKINKQNQKKSSKFKPSKAKKRLSTKQTKPSP